MAYVIFDSGVGGMSVLKEFIDQQIETEFIYFADNKNMPYGEKTKEFILHSVVGCLEKLTEIRKDLSGIILACNTASILTTNVLRKKFKIPIFSIAEFTKEKIIPGLKFDSIMLATSRSVESGYFYDEKVNLVSCPKFAPLVEDIYASSKTRKEIVNQTLNGVEINKGGMVILGCTHYPFLTEELRGFFSEDIKIIDPAKEFVQEIEPYLDKKQFKLEIITTGSSYGVESFYKQRVQKIFLEKNSLKMLEGVM